MLHCFGFLKYRHSFMLSDLTGNSLLHLMFNFLRCNRAVLSIPSSRLLACGGPPYVTTPIIYAFPCNSGHLHRANFFFFVCDYNQGFSGCPWTYLQVHMCEISLGNIPRNGTAEWEGVLIFNFTNYQMVLKNDWVNDTS